LPATIWPLPFGWGLSRLFRRRPGYLWLRRGRALPFRGRWLRRRSALLLPTHLLLLLLLPLQILLLALNVRLRLLLLPHLSGRRVLPLV
jgi:hypothetical protein